MTEENKGKIQIKPRASRGLVTNSKGLDDLKQELKRLKKYIARLNASSNYEEEILENNRDATIHIVLLDGSTEEGILKDITKYQIVVDQSGRLSYFYKSAIVKYFFG